MAHRVLQQPHFGRLLNRQNVSLLLADLKDLPSSFPAVMSPPPDDLHLHVDEVWTKSRTEIGLKSQRIKGDLNCSQSNGSLRISEADVDLIL